MDEPTRDQDGKNRRMVKATLHGLHTHQSAEGISVHIWKRRDSFLARGRFERKQFGQTLGRTEIDAEVSLCHLLTALDDGSFLPPCLVRDMPVVTKIPSRLRLEQLAAQFLHEKRRLKGEATMGDYRSRLNPVLAFASLPDTRRRWPYAHSVDRPFALECRAYLHTTTTTRNGKPGAAHKNYSARLIHNILETVRSMLNWAVRPTVRKLPPSFANPFTNEIVGSRGEKDPLRKQVLPLNVRIQMAGLLDCWQLGCLGLALALPLRPEELTSLLISDVDLIQHVLTFGTRFGGGDYTKGKQSFIIPLPEEIEKLIIGCMGDRTEGPLLCRRAISNFEQFPRKTVYSREELELCFNKALSKAGSKVQTEQDRKRVFRKLLLDLGGISTDDLRAEFKSIAARLGLKDRLYDLRHAVTTDMHRAGVGHLELTYLTGHTTREILSEYISCDPWGSMTKYSTVAKPLFNAMMARGRQLNCLVDDETHLSMTGPVIRDFELVDP